MPIEHWNRETDGKLNEDNLRSKLEARGYVVTRYTYTPGTRFPSHTHTVDKIDAILTGTFKMTMFGQEMILRAGDCLEVPGGIPHSAEVIGDEPVVSLDAVRRNFG